MTRLRRIVRLAMLFVVIAVSSTLVRADEQQRWVTTWASAPDQAGPVLGPVTIRQIIRTSTGGTSLRIRLSNLYGNGKLRVGGANVAVYAKGTAIVPATIHELTFHRATSLQIAQGDSALSDPVNIPVEALQTLAVSLYLPGQATHSTLHGVGIDNTYIQRGKDATTSEVLPTAKLTGSRFYLTDVEVAGIASSTGTLVGLGDSITDGVGSTTDNNGWVSVLAVRLQSVAQVTCVGVVNSGIAGNRLLQDADSPFRGYSALARFDRDVLDKSSVHWVLLQIGINDIGADNFLANAQARVTAQQLVDGIKNLIALAHVKGVRVIGSTLTPNADADLGVANRKYYSAAGEAKRQAVNAWIRHAEAFDAVVDFDQVLRDPEHPNHLLAAYDSGDHLHPNDAGHKAMADAIDLNLFN